MRKATNISYRNWIENTKENPEVREELAAYGPDTDAFLTHVLQVPATVSTGALAELRPKSTADLFRELPFPPPEHPKFTFIDLFAGIGGFHLAMTKLGGKCVFADEWDKDAQDTYEMNYGLRPYGDITKIDEKIIPRHDVLCAGFPCQPFSKAGKQAGFEDETKGTLFFDIERILKYHKTKLILLENVRNLVSHDDGRTWKTISSHLKSIGYRLVEEPLIISPHYLGIPQLRERVLIPGIYDPAHVDVPLIIDHSSWQTKDTCSLEKILEEGLVESNYYLSEQEVKEIDMWNEFYCGIKERVIGFPIWAEWFTKTAPASFPEWKKQFVQKNNALYQNNKTFIDSWLNKHEHLKNVTPTMRKMEWQCGEEVKNLWDALMQKRPSGLRVKKPNCAPALVAIVQIPIVGWLRRRLTVREAARLQSFPDEFIPSSNRQQAYKQFGNAVNVDVVVFCMQKLLNIAKGKEV